MTHSVNVKNLFYIFRKSTENQRGVFDRPPLKSHFRSGLFIQSLLASIAHRGNGSHSLQRKGRWESNINVWFPFMYSQKWNCYFQNTDIMFSLSVPIHSYTCERFTYFQDRSAYSAAGKYGDRSWEYINHPQRHKCGNWDWGRAIPIKGIHKWDFPCSAVAHTRTHNFLIPTFPQHPSADTHTW